MYEAFDPETFRRQGRAVVDRLADHLAACDARALPVLPWMEPRANVQAWTDDFTGGADPVTLFGRVIDGATHLQHPGFVGHQVTSPLPVGAIATLVSGLLNNGAAVYEMGPVTTAMERVLAAYLARKLGYPASADGVFTSGGSLGNLTALLAARAHAKLGENERGAVLACEEAHYSTARAVRIMGWGEGGLVKVPADERFRMRVDCLAEAHAAAIRDGRRVVAVVASACSTSTGAFDPLTEIADFCAEHGIWMHVDGAHGASFALSPKHRGLLRGIERADSVVWDAHKMMLCPALITAVLFKRSADSFLAFHGTEAAYLLNEEEEIDSALRVVECTKQMLVLPLYAALAVHGEGMIGNYLDAIIDLAHDFARTLRATPDFEVAVAPECNIVCFRHREDDERQERIRRTLLEDGSFYIVKTRLRGKTYLRTTLINPRTTADDLARLVTAIRAVP